MSIRRARREVDLNRLAWSEIRRSRILRIGVDVYYCCGADLHDEGRTEGVVCRTAEFSDVFGGAHLDAVEEDFTVVETETARGRVC